MLKTFLTTSLLSLGLVACQVADTASNIRIDNASFRAPLPGQTTGVAYFDIINDGGSDVLIAASSNASARVELHNHIHEGGMMKMRQVDQVQIPEKGMLSFDSGGLHVMIFNAEIDGPVSLTLDFKTHADITIQLETLSN